MSVRIMSQVWELTLPDSQKLVLLALADCASDEGKAWPSIPTIARKCSRGERTVQGVMIELEKAGHITRDQRPGVGCHYTVHPRSDCAPAAAAPRNRRTPATAAPAQPAADTPAAAAPKPSRTITSPEAPPPSSARAPKPQPFRLPDDWRPSRFADGTVSREVIDRRGVEWARAALESFRNWAANAEDKPGRGRKLDWQAAWGNWVIKQDGDDGGRQSGSTNCVGGNRRGHSTSGMGRTVDAGQRFLERRGLA